MSDTQLFQRNRALGYITNHVKGSVRYIRARKENVIVTCIGRAFHTYSSSHFRLICVSGQHPDEITALSADHYAVYTASGGKIYAWRAGKEIRHIYKGHDKPIILLLPFGNHLISVDEDNVLKIWEIRTTDLYLTLPFLPTDFKITAMVHPPTYLNKILLGSEQGTMQLWNIKSSKLIFAFPTFNSRITILEAAPAVDIVAVGLHDGSIILHNLKLNETLMKFKQECGAVLNIAFRTDGPPIMCTSSNNGNLVFWNLEEQKIAYQLVAHHDAITTATCFVSEPLLFTTSSDNSMKLWVFDMPDGGPRLLRYREGHAAPPTCIRYYGASGVNILSAGEDSTLRIFSTLSESLNRSFGKASYNKKKSKRLNAFDEDVHIMPPIKYFTSETTREKEWDNIGAIHSGIITTTTWSFGKSKMGELKLVPEKFQNKNRRDFISEPSCIVLSHCGNFVLIGYTSGDLERFNIQSGIHRASYGSPAYHNAAVRGIFTDNLNQIVVSGGSNGQVKFWKFNETVQTPFATMSLNEGVLFFRDHRESSLICAALENFTINLFDCHTRVIVRKFLGHTGQLTDACFSPDGRWLVSSAMDCTVKVWDIPSAYMIDHFKFENACVSLTISPTSDFLATAHVGNLGIYLWSNKTLFNHVSIRSIDPYSDPPVIDLPISVENTPSQGETNEIIEGELIDSNYDTPLQLDHGLITMSGLATSKWQNLLDLDTIKKRNKPTLPPKVQKHAPFFLPTVAGLETKFDVSEEIKAHEEGKKIIKKTNFHNLSRFGQMLYNKTDANEENYTDCIEYMMKLGPSMVDYEIKSLEPVGGGNIEVMLRFMKMLEFMLNSNINFELGQSYLGLFLKSHGKLISETPQLCKELDNLEECQNKSWKILEQKLFYGLGVVSALRNFTHEL